MSTSNVKKKRKRHKKKKKYQPPQKKLSSSESSSSDEDYSDDEDEGRDGYKKGGYHPVQIGEMYKNRYEIKSKLGWGHFSTVWAALDHVSMKYVALKVQKSAEHYTEAAIDEIKLLSKVNKTDSSKSGVPVVKLLDNFFHDGPNGTHMCFVFEVLGQNLLSVIKDNNYKGCPILSVREIARQVAEGLAFLHDECGIIHTDLKPENILVVRPKQDVLDHLEHYPLVASTSLSETKDKKETISKKNSTTTFVPRTQSVMRHIENEDSVSKLKREIDEIVAEMNGMELSKSQKKRKKQKLKKKREQLEKEICEASSTNSTSVVVTTVSSKGRDKKVEEVVVEEEDDKRYSFAILRICANSCSPNRTPTVQVLCNDRNQAMLWVQHALAVEYVITNGMYRREHVGEILIARIDSKIRNRWIRTRGLWFVDFGEIATTSTLKKRKRSGSQHMHSRSRGRLKSSKSSSFRSYFEDSDPTILRVALETIRSFVEVNISSSLLLSSSAMKTNDFMKLVAANEKDWTYPSKSYLGRFVFAAPFDVVNTVFERIISSFEKEETKKTSNQFHFRVVGKDFNHVIMLKAHKEKQDLLIRDSINRFVGLALHPYHQNHHHTNDEKDDEMIILYTVRFDVRHMKNVIACLENYIHGLRFFRVPHQCSLSLDSTVLKELTLPYSARETSFGAMGTIICDSSLKHVRCLEDRLEVWSRFWDEEEEEEEREENDGVLLRNSIYFNDGRPIQVKIVDLGNSCWRDEHFSEDIQTRQYRCPEVILANGYDTPADMWSYACLLFELYTGDILFDPKADDHGSFSRDEDHIAQAQELLGVIPRHISRKSKIGRSFFNRNGEMIRIKDLKFWKIKDVLMEKYGKEETEAEIFADFLEKCMAFNPDHRATARQCLDHPFLNSTKWFSSKARREGNDDDLDRSMTSRSPRK